MSDFESKRISEIISPSDSGDASTRSHERHTLADLRIASLRFPSGLTGTIKNLSYSGISVEFSKDQVQNIQNYFNADRKNCEGVLQLANESIFTTMSLVRLIGRKAAFTFIHDSAQTLVFLREILEPMRIGTTMKPVRGFNGEEWRDLRFTIKGEAHSELDIIINPSGDLIYSRLTFSNQGYFFEVTLKEGQINTGIAVVNFGSAAQTQDTKQLDTKLLRQSIFILLGFNNEVVSDQKIELIDHILQSMEEVDTKNQEDPAA